MNWSTRTRVVHRWVTAAVSSPSTSSRSAAISLHAIHSGLCRFLIAMILSSLPAHNMGRKTPMSHASTDRGRATVDGDPRSILREIGALAKTPMCPAGAVLEIIRDALHRALARDVDEVWFFSIVQSTYETFVKHLGCLTVRPIGNAVRLRKSGVRSHVRLVPVIVEPRRFLERLYRCATTPANPRARTQLASLSSLQKGCPKTTSANR